jgi:Ca2+-transporting ATPase
MQPSEHLFKKTFWSLSSEEVVGELKSHPDTGLSEFEAEKRLSVFGKNKIESSKKVPGLKILLRQFTSPLILILTGATFVTVFISHYRDAIFIAIAIVVNALLGFYQEYKAERALSELATYLKQRSRVVRGGVEKDIDTELIVPGDIVRLSQGDRIPADARIIFSNDVQIDESILTGESLPVSKSEIPVVVEKTLPDQTSMVFAGTLLTQGVATVVVCRVGHQTEFGKIASLIASAENEDTPLQKSIKKFSVHVSVVLGLLTVCVFVVGVVAGHSVPDMFLTAVALAVSAIPEGLPVALTVILSVGVQKMARRKGVVRKLVAAETLGSTTVILTDKTGTLTTAHMELRNVISLGGLDEESVLKRGLANADVVIENPDEDPKTWRMDGRIMEMALVRGAALRGVFRKGLHTVIESLPFNAVNKFSVSLISEHGSNTLVFFGAPDVLLRRSTLNHVDRERVMIAIDTRASTGERVLGVGHKKVGVKAEMNLLKNTESEFHDIELDGLITFYDPVRPHVKDSINRVHKAGIRTVIMTGDHSGTACAVARDVGMSVDADSVMDALEIADLSESELKKRLAHVQVISRVTPSDKLRVVRAFQAQGEVVAMTGDGVNDAPSIRQADVGIAMGSGTEVSRSVADLVLLNDDFETIVAAVEEGRQIMGNIKKVIVYLLSNVADGLILIGGSIITGIPLPLNALQILWVNFFLDSFPAVSFAFEKESSASLMRPQKRQKGLFDTRMLFLVVVVGLTTSLLLFGMYFVLLKMGFNEQLVRTFIFAAFSSYTLFLALAVRSLDKSILAYSLWSNMYMIWAIVIGFALTAVAIYVPFFQSLLDTVPLSLGWVLAVFGVGIVNILFIELGKWLFKGNFGRS